MMKRTNKVTNDVLTQAISIVLALTVFILLPAWAGHVENHYKMNCEVTNVKGELITVEDSTGNLWDFYGNDFSRGDRVKVTFYTNLSNNTREDDIIKDVIKIEKK